MIKYVRNASYNKMMKYVRNASYNKVSDKICKKYELW